MIIGVYGLGRFGAFWAELLSGVSPVKAYNRSSRPTPPGVERCSLEELGTCDVIFICTAISSVEQVCQNMAPYLKEGILVADTCSVKVIPLENMKKHLPDHCSILGTHPMFGPDSARDGVKNLPIVLTQGDLDQEQFRFWVDYFKNMGMDTIEMSAQEHDREAAYTQGVTHFIGRMLREFNLKDSAIATKGYRALQEIVTQTCNDPWQLFLDLQSYNPYTKSMRTKLDEVMNKMIIQFDSIETQGEDLG